MKHKYNIGQENGVRLFVKTQPLDNLNAYQLCARLGEPYMGIYRRESELSPIHNPVYKEES